jgi:hypothetical protein
LQLESRLAGRGCEAQSWGIVRGYFNMCLKIIVVAALPYFFRGASTFRITSSHLCISFAGPTTVGSLVVNARTTGCAASCRFVKAPNMDTSSFGRTSAGEQFEITNTLSPKYPASIKAWW